MAGERILTTDNDKKMTAQVGNTDIVIVGEGICPATDATGIYVTKADGLPASAVARIDTTNGRICIGGGTSPQARIDVTATDGSVPSIKLAQSTLTTAPVNGAIEYASDGFWISHAGARTKINSGGTGGSASDITYSDTVAPTLDAATVQSAIDNIKPLNNRIVFQPGGTAGKGIYTTWATAVAAANAVQGPKTFIVDLSIYGAAYTVPAGYYVFGNGTTIQGRTFMDGVEFSAVSPRLVLANGTSFIGVDAFKDIYIDGSARTDNPSLIPNFDLNKVSLRIQGTAKIEGSATSSITHYDTALGTTNNILVEDYGVLGPYCIMSTGPMTTNVILKDKAKIAANAFKGTAGAGSLNILYYPSASVTAQTLYPNTVTYTNLVAIVGSDLVYSTSITADNVKVFNNWAQFVKCARGINGPKTVWIDLSAGNVTIPAGTHDFGTQTTIRGFPQNDEILGGCSGQILPSNGTQLTGVIAFQDVYVNGASRTDALGLVTLSGVNESFQILGNTIIEGSATAPIIADTLEHSSIIARGRSQIKANAIYNSFSVGGRAPHLYLYLEDYASITSGPIRSLTQLIVHVNYSDTNSKPETIGGTNVTAIWQDVSVKSHDNIVFAVAGTSNFNGKVYANWSEFVTAAYNIPGPKTIWIDPRNADGYAVPQGVWDFGSPTTLCGFPMHYTSGEGAVAYPLLSIGNNVTLAGICEVRDVTIDASARTDGYAVLTLGSDLTGITLSGHTRIIGSANTAVLRIASNRTLTLKDFAVVQGNAISIDATSLAIINMLEYATLDVGAIKGSAGIGNLAVNFSSTCTLPETFAPGYANSFYLQNLDGAILNNLVYAPSGTSEFKGRIFKNWSSFVAAAYKIQGPKTVWLDIASSSPTLPAGTWDFGPETILAGLSYYDNSADQNWFTIGDGTTLPGVIAIQDLNVYVSKTDGIAPFQIKEGGCFTVQGLSTLYGVGATPCVGLIGINARIVARDRSQVHNNIAHLSNTGLNVELQDLATCNALSFSGDATSWLTVSNNSLAPIFTSANDFGAFPSQTNFLGTFYVTEPYRTGISANTGQCRPVRAVSTANIATLSGLATTVDGVALNSAGTRVLLTGQATQTQNGIWIVQSGAWARPYDFRDGYYCSGWQVAVQEGSTLASSTWICTSTAGSIIGSHALAFAQTGKRYRCFDLSVNNAIVPVTNPATLVTAESTTYKRNYKALEFSATATNSAEWIFTIPSDYAGGTILVTPHWLSTTAGAANPNNTVYWSIQASVVSFLSMDVAWGTTAYVKDTYSTAYAANVTLTSSGAVVTIGGTPVAGSAVSLRLTRNGADATNDLFAGTARLHALYIRYMAY